MHEIGGVDYKASRKRRLDGRVDWKIRGGREREATNETFMLVSWAWRDRFWRFPKEVVLPETGQNRVVTEIIETAVLWALKAV